MQSLFCFLLTALPFTLNLFLNTLIIFTITISSIATTTTATTTTSSYPIKASSWLSRRETPGFNFNFDNINKNNNGDYGNDDNDDDNGEYIPSGSTSSSNPRNPPEITWLWIWRPLEDPPSSPRGHLHSMVEDDQNISYAAADWEGGNIPQIKSRAIAIEVVEFNGIEDFTVKLISPSAGTAIVRFRRGVNLRCFEDPDKQPGMWICLYELSLSENVRRLLNS